MDSFDRSNEIFSEEYPEIFISAYPQYVEHGEITYNVSTLLSNSEQTSDLTSLDLNSLSFSMSSTRSKPKNDLQSPTILDIKEDIEFDSAIKALQKTNNSTVSFESRNEENLSPKILIDSSDEPLGENFCFGDKAKENRTDSVGEMPEKPEGVSSVNKMAPKKSIENLLTFMKKNEETEQKKTRDKNGGFSCKKCIIS